MVFDCAINMFDLICGGFIVGLTAGAFVRSSVLRPGPSCMLRRPRCGRQPQPLCVCVQVVEHFLEAGVLFNKDIRDIKGCLAAHALALCNYSKIKSTSIDCCSS